MDQHRLAGHQVKAAVTERERSGGTLRVAKPVRQPRGVRLARGLCHPLWLEVHADRCRLGSGDDVKQPPPVPLAAANVQDGPHADKFEPSA
jgi:hypothetical protein